MLLVPHRLRKQRAEVIQGVLTEISSVVGRGSKCVERLCRKREHMRQR
jgi:hypothetical protein